MQKSIIPTSNIVDTTGLFVDDALTLSSFSKSKFLLLVVATEYMLKVGTSDVNI